MTELNSKLKQTILSSTQRGFQCVISMRASKTCKGIELWTSFSIGFHCPLESASNNVMKPSMSLCEKRWSVNIQSKRSHKFCYLWESFANTYDHCYYPIYWISKHSLRMKYQQDNIISISFNIGKCFILKLL